MQDVHRREPVIRSIDYGVAPHEAPAPSFHLVLESLARHWSLIATTTATALVMAFLYLAFATSQYTATGLILIDTKSNAPLRSSSPTVTDANVESANIESLVELLKSEHTLRHVVESESLEDDPALNPNPIGRFVQSTVRSIKFWKQDAAMPEDRGMAAARALQKLTSARRLGLTYAVEVSATMPDPTQAAKVANAYARAFIDDQRRLREELARRMSGLLEARTDELQAQAEKAERAVEQLKFSGSVEGENSASTRVMLKKLESAAQTYRLLHDKFLERYAETWQQQFLSMPDAQIASPAFPPQSKSAPKTLVVLAASLFIGAALGVIVMILRDRRALGLRSS